MGDERDLAQIPYFAHEGDMARLERINKRQFILILVLIVALVGSNLAWITYENQFQDVVTTSTEKVDVDAGDGGNAIGFIGDENEVNYGEGDSD